MRKSYPVRVKKVRRSALFVRSRWGLVRFELSKSDRANLQRLYRLWAVSDATSASWAWSFIISVGIQSELESMKRGAVEDLEIMKRDMARDLEAVAEKIKVLQA